MDRVAYSAVDVAMFMKEPLLKPQTSPGRSVFQVQAAPPRHALGQVVLRIVAKVWRYVPAPGHRHWATAIAHPAGSLIKKICLLQLIRLCLNPTSRLSYTKLSTWPCLLENSERSKKCRSFTEVRASPEVTRDKGMKDEGVMAAEHQRDTAAGAISLVGRPVVRELHSIPTRLAQTIHPFTVVRTALNSVVTAGL